MLYHLNVQSTLIFRYIFLQALCFVDLASFIESLKPKSI